MMTDILKEDNVNLIVNDGLSYLRENEKKYDAILIDIENPTVAHASNLYTVEAFMIISDSLDEEGTFALWNFISGSEKIRYLDILYYSMKEAFDFVYWYPDVFLGSNHKLNQSEYIPHGDYEINTIDKNTLTRAYEKRTR